MDTEDAGGEEAVVITGDPAAADDHEAPHEEGDATVLAVAGQEGDSDKGEQAGEQQVIEFVVEDSSTAVAAPVSEQEASSVTLVPMADGAKTIEAITADGSIAYIQVRERVCGNFTSVTHC